MSRFKRLIKRLEWAKKFPKLHHQLYKFHQLFLFDFSISRVFQVTMPFQRQEYQISKSCWFSADETLFENQILWNDLWNLSFGPWALKWIEPQHLYPQKLPGDWAAHISIHSFIYRFFETWNNKFKWASKSYSAKDPISINLKTNHSNLNKTFSYFRQVMAKPWPYRLYIKANLKKKVSSMKLLTESLFFSFHATNTHTETHTLHFQFCKI